MNKFDFIFLLISSDDLECYKHMRYYASKYFGLYETKIKYFFIEMNNDLDCDICEIDNYIYIKGQESLTPGIYIKTMKSIKYINEKYDYDFIVRSNLSSFWNLNKLLLIKNQLSLNNFAGGFQLHNGVVLFITGTGIILSKDTCISLSNNMMVSNEHDDVLISIQLRQLGYKLENFLHKYRTEWLTKNINNVEHITDKDNILYYRIKNSDRNIDVQLFKILCDKMYNI